MKEIVTFDTEIKNTIGQNGVTWATYDKMGVSIACAHRHKTGEYLTFMDDNLHELCELLNDADLVVGFNIKGFDIPLINATDKAKGLLRGDLKIYDILEYSRRAVGYHNGPNRPKGMRLDDHLLGTFGQDFMKTQDGADAPLFWQRGELGKLISYCLADVHREAKLFNHIMDHGFVVTPTHGKREVELPWPK